MDRNAARARTFPFAHLLAATLLVASTALAQTPMNDFKPGDWAQAQVAGSWVTVTIAAPQDYGAYKSNYGPNIINVIADSAHLRHYTPTAAELAIQAETAAALQRQSKGASTGAKYGTREPTACANRKAAPTAATARQYFICDSEGVTPADNLYLVTSVTLQLGAARKFNYDQESNAIAIDVRAPVYDLRGAYTMYQCGKQSTDSNDFANTHNCIKYPYTSATGRCWKDTYADWHCTMMGSGGDALKDQMPPA